ncbi:hypothetical protein KY289_007930 [Solanum tuberosum]|nr:hypothetical protein KY289_007930 [Solanum tuberosum]
MEAGMPLVELELEGFVEIIEIVVEMIKGNYNIPWQMKNIITRIQNISSTITCEVRHCYREANQVADALAK